MEKSSNIKINFKYIWKGNRMGAAAEGRRPPSEGRLEAALPLQMYFQFCTYVVTTLCVLL